MQLVERVSTFSSYSCSNSQQVSTQPETLFPQSHQKLRQDKFIDAYKIPIRYLSGPTED